MSDKGFTDKVKGKVKKTVGDATGDNSVKAEGVLGCWKSKRSGIGYQRCCSGSSGKSKRCY